MYLEKLKIFGFKSFAKKTSLSFSNGLIGIVGPNGCGKSNIVDAIRWVLGEQKAGILRSDRMENVIFNGTKDLKPLGMAEVALTIQNTKNILPVEYSEVVITRRLFRSGESQYLLNNSVCRLKDINDLLMDTGMAPDAYSVIELSMVESILSGKPDERRRIFEEASGVTKYKQRRKITFRKLEATGNDLIRVDDIINEVEHKVNSLRRQVKRAQRYQTLTQQLKDIEIKTATHQYSQIYEELVPLTEQLEGKRRNRESSTAQISFKEAETESLKTELIRIEQNLRKFQLELNSTNDLIRKREQEILVSRERLKSLAANKVRLQAETEQLQKKIGEQNKTSEKLTIDLEQINTRIEIEDNNYREEEEALEKFEKQLFYKREEGKQAENEMLGLLNEFSKKRGNLEHLKATLQHLQNRISELETEKTSSVKKIASYKNQLKTLAKEDAEKTTQLEKLTLLQLELTQQLEKFSADIDLAKEEIVNGNSQLDTLQHRIAILSKLLESYADYPEGVKHLMVEGAGYHGTVADVISVEEKYREAIETALGEAATYLLANDSEQVFVGINSLKEKRKGIVTFLPLKKFSENNDKHATINISLPDNEVVGWADNLIQCEPNYRYLLNTLLGDCLVVPDLSVVERHPEIFSSNSVNVVTLAGEMVAAWGGIKGGKKSHDEAGFIGRKDQLRKFQQQIDQIQLKIQKAKENKQQLEQAQAEKLKQKETAQNGVTILEKELSETKLKISQIQYENDQSEELIRKIEQEVTSLNQKIELTQQDINKLTKELDREKQVRVLQEEDILRFSQEIDALVSEREKMSQKVHQFKLTLVQLNSEAKNIQGEIDRSNNVVSESENSIKSKNNELVENKKLGQELTARVDELSTSLIDDYAQKEKFEKEVASIEEQQFSVKENIEQKEKVLRQLRSERETFSEEIHSRELRIAELKLSADNLFRQIGEDYNWDLKKEPVDESYELGAAKEEIDRLKQRLKSLGPVNLLALKEYETEKERLDFLNKQHDDLIEAKQNLMDTVSHINKTARQKFIEVFKSIRANFSDVFQQFFSDGEADIIYSEDDDPLEANIEIMANPKGKRPTSLTLLSGGEKALTAISLLFAIYLVKPSPFCILDEVDAPLDDNNIQRFSTALRKFSADTQFLVVTHNKLTMKAADCLYGITMENTGVSKIVSVKFD